MVEYLESLIGFLENAQRTGIIDEPEGNKYIILSDTLANEITENLRKFVGETK